MEKIIFFGLVIPILAFVLYLGGTAIMNGFSAKSANKSIDKEEFKTRESLFTESSTYLLDLLSIEEKMLKPNSFLGWIKSIFWPKQ